MARIARAVLLALVVAALPGPAGAASCRAITGFEGPVGGFPEDWKPKEDRAREIYKVLEEGGLRFIRATAESTGIQMGLEVKWDLAREPVLAWRWRPRIFPAGADERQGGRNDSVAGVYAAFPHSPVSVKAVKYVWSAVAPPGTTASASRGLTRMLVLRSGSPPTDTGWVEEAVNVAEDYRRLFGEPPKAPQGIAVLTDADDTRSRAVGDYAAFRVCAAGTSATTAFRAGSLSD
jgi:hypothetical protein